MRAQTTIDFLIGMAAFLLTLGVVVAFVPGMLAPFDSGGTPTPVAGNRVVTGLATDELAAGGDPFVLSETAVDDYFSTTDADRRRRVGLADDVSLNVSLEWSGGTKTAGPPVPQQRSVTTTWRTVTYRGDGATLTVRLW
ncbi:MAG: hypothetical protein ABEJ59_04085 [Halanaeroarchaeum sp.]